MGSVMLFLIGGLIGFVLCKLTTKSKVVELGPTGDSSDNVNVVVKKGKVNKT
jgi:hypothetical protein